jgi:hypothetical protein
MSDSTVETRAANERDIEMFHWRDAMSSQKAARLHSARLIGCSR